MNWVIGFIDPFFVQSLVITINFQPYPSSLTAEDSPRSRSRSRSTILSNWTTLTLVSFRHGPHTENTALLSLLACLLGFSRECYAASPLARWLLPSNGLGANHIENTAPVLLAACLFERVYIATGVFWLHSLMLWANPSQYYRVGSEMDFVRNNREIEQMLYYLPSEFWY
jgi:hypothetical protein